MLFAAAFVMRFITQLQWFINNARVMEPHGDINFGLAIANQSIELAIITCFFVGFARTYYAIKFSTFTRN